VFAIFISLLLSGCVGYRAKYNPTTGEIELSGWRIGDQQLNVTAEKSADKTSLTVTQESQATALNDAIKIIDRLSK
jgi:hypothetical protein